MRCTGLPLLIALVVGCGEPSRDDAGTDARGSCEPLTPFDEGDDGHAEPLGAGPGEARAGRIAAGDLPADPRGLLGWSAGDFVLANDRVAVVIEDAGASDDFNPYGGQPIGAALVEDGAMVAPALFGEPTFTFGRTTVATRHVGVIADGRDGGPAIVRAVGGIASLGFLVFIGDLIGGDEVPSLEVALDYVLAPDSEHVEVRVQVLNPSPGEVLFRRPLLTSVQQNRMPKVAPGRGFDVPAGEAFEWLGFVDPIGASYAFEADGAPLRVLLEQSNFLFVSLPRFGAAGCAPTERVLGRLHVGGRGLDGLVAAMARTRGETIAAIEGVVHDARGAPASGARVYALGEGDALLTRTTTDDEGRFTVHVPEGARLLAWRRGADPSAEASATDGVTLTLGPSGVLSLTITDGDGAPLSALVQAIPSEGEPFVPPTAWGEAPIVRGRDAVAYAIGGTATLEVPAGPHRVVVSHGYEHELAQLDLDVDGELAESVALEHVVPTPGVMCGDFHVHTNRSFDAEDDAPLKVRAAAAEGVEIPLRSDHEWVNDFEPLIAELGLEGELYGIPSLELTTFVYGHFGVFPLDPDPSARNGGAIEWVERPPVDVLGEARAREGSFGRSELILYHPRSPAALLGYFSAVGYDPDTGGVAEESIWFDEFVLLEVFNGSDFDANEEEVVRDWFSFLARGRRVMAVGSSDSHEVSRSPIGYPRTCVEVGVDTAPALRALGAGHVRDRMVDGASVIVGGVYVDARVGAIGPGGTVEGAGATASIDVTVRAPSWVGVDSLRVFVDGALAEELAIDASTEDPIDPTTRFADAITVDVSAAGSFVVLVADGAGDLAPVHPGRRPFGVTNPIFFTR